MKTTIPNKRKRRPSIASLVIPDEDKLIQACLFPSSIWALPQEGGSITFRATAIALNDDGTVLALPQKGKYTSSHLPL